ncbi:MAG: ATP-binding protein [Cypionkella sp.]|jgi:PAS domain S-box-containing protein|nr:ATP-binding protein [Cypionkella sp.]
MKPSLPLSRTAQMPSSRILAVIGLVLGLLVAIGWLALDVRGRMAALERASKDTGQWVMMQTEVEVMRLRLELARAQLGEADLDVVRRWFNVFYSRLRVLRQSPIYADFIQQPDNIARLDVMQAYADRWVGVIDGAAPDLLRSLPEMERQSASVQAEARALSLDSLANFSASSDRTRNGVSDTLLRLALTTGAMVLLLGVFAAVVTRLFRMTQAQAHENQITGARLQMIIATSPDAIVVTNRGGWVVEFNPAAEAMFGLSRAAVMGRRIVPMIFSAKDQAQYQARLNSLVAEAVKVGPQRFEMTGLRADGSAFPLEISLAVRDFNRGALVVGFLRDVSQRHADRLALEQALTRAKAGEKAKADFLTVMSHEMRTPLNGLIGSMDLMHDTALSPEQQELLRVMEVSGDILLGHVDSVLDISRSEAGQIRLRDVDFDLDRLIEDCVANQASLARSGGNVIRMAPLTGALGRVRGDPGRVQQILLNLIGNAVKFTRDGTITVETERQPQRSGHDAPQIIEFRVIDTGIGIAEADMPRVFDDFAMLDSSFTRPADGTGLGLGIARRLVQAMGGTIGVESELGEGSVFWLRLPFRAAEQAARTQGPIDPPEPRPPQPTPPLDILVIEDNEINRSLLKRYLVQDNHRVTEAEDGLQGVEIASRIRFDVIITDISMPRLDGVEAARRIRAGGASAKARIIALTAHALPAEQDNARAAGMDLCLIKPVTRSTLRAQLTASLPPPDAQPPDPTALDDMVQTLGRPAVQRLVQRFLHEGRDALPRLLSATLPAPEAAALAHHVAGSCATFGATQMQETLAGLEHALAHDDDSAARHLRQMLPLQWAATERMLADLMAPEPVNPR